MVHSAASQPQSIALLVALTAMHGFDIWTADARQAYQQFTEPICRDLFITRPAPEFELRHDQCLKLLKPLHGLCDSGDLWHKTIDNHYCKELGMSPMKSDPALYTTMSDGLLTGLSGGYVDDLLRAGIPEFREYASLTNRRFEMDADEELPCTFSGFSLSRQETGCLEQNQHFYLQNLESLSLKSSFSQFHSMRMRLACLANRFRNSPKSPRPCSRRRGLRTFVGSIELLATPSAAASLSSYRSWTQPRSASWVSLTHPSPTTMTFPLSSDTSASCPTPLDDLYPSNLNLTSPSASYL